MQSCFTIFFIGLVVAALSGCGDGRPTRVPVSGQVLIDGKPLTHGEIRFVSSVGRASQGKLDKQGRFQLSCYEENDGALIGTHKVSITAAAGLSQTETRWYAPKKYSDYRTSGLTQEITGPIDNLVIKITWERGHEFVEVEPGSSGEEVMQGARGRRKKSGE